MKEAVEVAIAGFVVVGVFDTVDQHASQSGVVQGLNAPAGGDGVRAGAEVLVERPSSGGHHQIPGDVVIHEPGLHEPHSEIHHGLYGSGMEHDGGLEKLPGRHEREKPFNVVEIQAELTGGGGDGGFGVGGGGDGGGLFLELRLLEQGGGRGGRRERGVGGVEVFGGGGVVTDLLEDSWRDYTGGHQQEQRRFDEMRRNLFLFLSSLLESLSLSLEALGLFLCGATHQNTICKEISEAGLVL